MIGAVEGTDQMEIEPASLLLLERIEETSEPLMQIENISGEKDSERVDEPMNELVNVVNESINAPSAKVQSKEIEDVIEGQPTSPPTSIPTRTSDLGSGNMAILMGVSSPPPLKARIL